MPKEFVVLFPTGMRFLSSRKHPDQSWRPLGIFLRGIAAEA